MFNLRAFLGNATLAATLLLAANPLAAAPNTQTVAVQSRDLNLNSDAGRAALRQRIAHAVSQVCGTAHPRTTADAEAYTACRDSALATANSQYDMVVAKAQAERKVAGAPLVNRPVE
jgi:UrcA family protein